MNTIWRPLILLFSLDCSIFAKNLYNSESVEDEEILPGRKQLLDETEMNVRSDGMAFAFGTARRETDAKPFVQMETNGEKFRLPKGIYHYSAHDTGFDGKWTIPEEGNLWTGAGNVKDNYRNIDGIYMRNPLAPPINVQVITERRWEHGLEGSASDQTPADALRKAQKICLHDEGKRCEVALNEYYDLRTEFIAQQSAPLHEKLAQLGDVASSTQIHSKIGNGVGLLLDVPGQEKPLYVGAALNRNVDRDFRVLFQPPRPQSGFF